MFRSDLPQVPWTWSGVSLVDRSSNRTSSILFLSFFLPISIAHTPSFLLPSSSLLLSSRSALAFISLLSSCCLSSVHLGGHRIVSAGSHTSWRVRLPCLHLSAWLQVSWLSPLVLQVQAKMELLNVLGSIVLLQALLCLAFEIVVASRLSEWI